MTLAARFRVDPQLAALLGEGYRSSEHALKELVDNAWDADAAVVSVTLPGPLTADAVVVEDDGTGMTEAEIRRDYLAIARSRRSRKGDHTLERHRSVKGRKGIGKFAGLMVSDIMTIESRCRGVCTRLVIKKTDIVAHGTRLTQPERPVNSADQRPEHLGGPGEGRDVTDLEGIDLPLDTRPCALGDHGTIVTLEGLSQVFDPPSPDRLKALLMLEYGRHADFDIAVNGEAIGVEDITGESFSHQAQLDGVGTVLLRFTISEGPKPLRHWGVALRATGKVIAKPMVFGLDSDEEIPPKLLRKVYGELDADGLANSATGDWGDVIETRAFAAVSTWAAQHLKTALSAVYSNEVQLARARLSQQIARRLSQLPEHRRSFAEQHIARLIARSYGEKEERIATVVSLALDAIEQDDYYDVVKAVDAASDKDVATFAAALEAFGLVDLAHMGDQARKRLAFLDRLDELIANRATREQEMHTSLEHNMWVLGAQYAMLASNRTLRRVVEDIGSTPYLGEHGSERPDLLLLSNFSGRHVLIEFKRPSLEITRFHEGQVTAYRDELINKFPGGIDTLLIGRAWARGSDRTNVAAHLTVTSYAALISSARAEIVWLLQQLTENASFAA